MNSFYADKRTFKCGTCSKVSLMRRNGKSMYCSRACLPICQPGRIISEKTKQKMSNNSKGLHKSPNTEIKSGQRLSVATEFAKGHTPWHKGRIGVYSIEQLARITDANRANGIKLRGENSPHWKGGIKNCKDCGKKLAILASKLCRTCSGKYRRGENSYNWKGGVTTENNKQRDLFRKVIQMKVFKRDNFTCQVCCSAGNNLQVDHIKSWKDYPELRFDMDNCRTLCMACHYYITFKRKMPEGTIWGYNFSRRIA